MKYTPSLGPFICRDNPWAVRGKNKLMASVEDVSADGFPDLVVHIEVENLDLTEGDIEAVLTGELMDGTPIEGSDAVTIVRDCP